MFRIILILTGGFSFLSATILPLKEESHFFGHELPSQEQVDRLEAEEGVESNLMFEGIPVKLRVNRHLERGDDEPEEEEVLEEPHLNMSDIRTNFYGEHHERYVNPDGSLKYNWLVYIWFSSSKTFTGSLICPKIVLTAGHVVYGQSVSAARVYQSPSKLCPPDKSPVRAEAFYSLFTLNYNAYSPGAHDIGAIKLQKSLANSYVTYFNIMGGVAAPPYSWSFGVGYGLDGTGNKYGSKCRPTYSKFYASSCKGLFYNPGQWICVKAKKTNGGACYGDDGGPLLQNTIIGVGSFIFGSTNCFQQKATVYTSIYWYKTLLLKIANDWGGC